MQLGSTPSPLAGEGGGEGWAWRGQLALLINRPLTLALSREGRGDKTSLTLHAKDKLTHNA